ncbi:MAG: nitroreductase family protein [Promethearchaeota archaeon]
MPIEGIDSMRCNHCGLCINECPRGNFSVNGVEKTITFDSSEGCILCGHCIAVCPERAIISTGMDDIPFDFNESNLSISPQDLNKLMLSKRSIRKYKNKKVPKEIIEKLINCMRYAPTAMNKRSLKCLVISDEQKINEFIDSIIEAIEEDEEREMYKKKREKGIDPFFYKAPHILILHSDNKWDITNATIAITYAMLYAETLGLGSCWIGGVQIFLNENKEISERVLDIKDKIFGIMILGYPLVKYYRSVPRSPIKTRFFF